MHTITISVRGTLVKLHTRRSTDQEQGIICSAWGTGQKQFQRRDVVGSIPQGIRMRKDMEDQSNTEH